MRRQEDLRFNRIILTRRMVHTFLADLLYMFASHENNKI